MASEGVKTTLISAGKYKTEGNPYEPLSDEARAAMQAMVDDYYGMFTRAVAKGRGVSVDAVRNGFGEGRMVSASQAVKNGMADRVATLDQVLASHGVSRSGNRQAIAADSSALKRRLEIAAL
jgi:ClpP class serine protease